MTTSTKKEVVTQQKELPLVTQVDFSLESEGGAGFEETDKSSFAMPWLNLLQSGSPSCKRSDPGFIEGAIEGAYLLSSTKEIFVDGVEVVPVHFARRFSEWTLGDGNTRGSFVAEHLPDSEIVLSASKDERGTVISQNGTLLKDTRLHYVLVKTADGTFVPAVLGAASTQIKPSKAWMAQMMTKRIKAADGSWVQAPMYANSYRLTSGAASNTKGSWAIMKVDATATPVTELAVVESARAFRMMIKTANAIVNHSTVDESEDEVTVNAGEI